MAQGLISENDIQRAIDRLGVVVPESICRQFFTRERLLRLERMVDQRIAHPFLIDLIVRQQGPSLLAERQRRFGNKNTSIRRLLLQSLDEDDLRALFERVRRKPPPATRRTIEIDLADFKWHRGSSSALAITRAVGLPDAFAGLRTRRERANDYEIDTIGELKPLKAFQRGVLREVRTILDRNARAMVSSFTGTGKTRIGMEYVVDTITTSVEPALVLWVAQKGELLDQACDAIEQLWPWRGQEIGEPLKVFRYFEGNKFTDDIPERPTIVVASSQQIIARLESGDPFVEDVLRRARLVVIDEAHHALARGHQAIIEAYERFRDGEPCRTLGLTATPGRSNLLDPNESRELAKLFGQVLVVPRVADNGGALAWFQTKGYLSHLRHKGFPAPSQVPQTMGKLGRIDEMDQTGYREFTQKFLEVVGEDSTRNRYILERITVLEREGRHMLVFCCNIAQAELLAQALTVQGTPAGLIHHEIDARDRHHTIAQFRRGELKILFNVEVLTTGFDAPKVDTIVMCRPTLSRVLYEQMVGRGMRGPQMGGTEWCEIVDFTDNFGTFREPQAWEYFWEEWHSPQSDSFETTFEEFGWRVVAAEPEMEAEGEIGA